MRSSAFLAVLALAITTQTALAQSAQCPAKSDTVFILKGVNDDPGSVMSAVRKPNTLVLLEPDIDIAFSNSILNLNPGDGNPFIAFNQCVTLASFQPQTHVLSPAFPPPPWPVPGSGRTPHSLGPVLRYTLDGGRPDTAAFIQMACDPTNSAEGARVLGIRVFGPDFNDHRTSEKGIYILGCHDVEIANTELAGWGGAAITVDDHVNVPDIPDQEPKDIFVKIHDNYIHHNQYSNFHGHHLGYGVDVHVGAWAVIFQNVFDFNKHSITADGHSGGYIAMHNLILKGGGFVNSGFWIFGERNIHVVDVHGTKSCLSDNIEATGTNGAVLGGLLGGLIGGPLGAIVGIAVGGLVGGSDAVHHLFNCGEAGFAFDIVGNTFQYNKTHDIKIRGKPRGRGLISDNIFAPSSKDDAISLFSDDNVVVTSSNQFNVDAFGKYGVCDIDGDGIDDFVLMTGVSWWFSSAGQFPWSFLRADTTILKDVQFGDFDGDGRCDVIKDENGDGNWKISSGATAAFKPFGSFLAPLNEVRFGRFDPAIHDHRRIRPPTHAFWRNAEGFWFVTPLSHPNQWTLVGSSSFPLADLRFGSFTGDGVTDVLAIEEGHWAISHAAREMWRNLNPTLSDPVKDSNIFIANMNAADDNVDDVLRFDVQANIVPFGTSTATVTWQRSFHGRTPWGEWKSYVFTGDTSHPEDYVWPVGFVGQFSAAPGASSLTIDESRMGHFFFSNQGTEAGWLSLFHY